MKKRLLYWLADLAVVALSTLLLLALLAYVFLFNRRYL